MSQLLTVIVFLPLVAAVLCALAPKGNPGLPKWIAAVFSAVDLGLVVYLITGFDRSTGAMQFVEEVPWITQANITYALGIDGISLPLLFLSALLTLLAVLASWKIDRKPAFYFGMLMLLQVGMNGVFLALDLILFYVFWELVLVPMYFLIAQWGGPRREYASLKFFLYTLAGSVFMLVGIIALYLYTGSFDVRALVDSGLPAQVQWWLFGAFFLGFAVKVPLFPVHTWLPDAHVEAPTAGSVLLAGVMLKMGTYGFIRIAVPILPEGFAAWQMFIAVLAVISIVYGAAAAFAQTDAKKLIAYSSVSHMGFAMLGIASGTVAGMNGAMAVNVSHGFVTGMLFLVFGMMYDRLHTREISKISGVLAAMPAIGGLFAFASFASLGLPGLSGFVGEFLSLMGSWQSTAIPHWMTVAAAVGVLLGAAYMLWLMQRSILGTPSETVAEHASPIRAIEVLSVVPLVVCIVVMGVYWSSLLAYVDPAVRVLFGTMGA